MTSTHDWLERLDRTTEYRELKSIFSELASEADTSFGDTELAVSIDEAIRRIEQERARDRDELEEFEREYAGFKDRQSGVIGWFKRHLPFTETRRQELSHRDTIADQQAEILADNLTIARAQMLKQRLLPPESRQLGIDWRQWQTILSNCESSDRMADYAAAIRDLSHELSISEAFVRDIRKEIDAFAKADFSAKEDRQRQQEDIQAAQDELAVFDAEVHEECSLKSAAIKRAGELVTEELTRNDHGFRTLIDQIDQLRTSTQLAKKTAGAAKKIAELLASLKKLAGQAETCAGERAELETKIERRQRDLNSAKRRLKQAERALSEVSPPYDAARRRADHADAALGAAKRIYDQHRPATNNDPIDSTDPVEVEYQRLKQERDAAHDALAVVTASYESAESVRDDANSDCKKIERKLRKSEKAHEAICGQDDQILKQMTEAKKRVPKTLSEFEPLLNEFLHCAEALDFQSNVVQLNTTLQWRGVLGESSAWHDGDQMGRAARSTSNEDETEKRFQQFVDAIKNDRRELKKLLTDALQRRDDSWERRCKVLLGDEVAAWVTPAGDSECPQ